MAILNNAYRRASKLFQYEFAKKLKDKVRPLKHFLVGKQGIYRAIDEVKSFEISAGKNEIKTVFDIGAAIGEASLPMLRSFPEAHLYCFEPLKDSFEKLKERTAKFCNRTSYFNHGLYNRNGELEFNVFIDYPDSSSAVASAGQGRKIKAIIPIRRLDDVITELNIQKIDFMKIDVEGAEKEILEGAVKTLEITDNIYIEISPLRKGVHNHDYIDVFEYLHSAGFSLAGIYGDFFFSRLLR